MEEKITRCFDEYGRISIPKSIRQEFFGTKETDGVEMQIKIEDGKIALIPVKKGENMNNICDYDEGYERRDAYDIGWCHECKCNPKCPYKKKQNEYEKRQNSYYYKTNRNLL